MTVRLVATDLDGTLLHSDGTVSEGTREVLTALEQRGVTVVFVTGRPIRWMEALWAHVGDHGLAICSNGGIVYDVQQHRVRDSRPLPREATLEAAALVRAAVPGTTFALERTVGFAREADFVPRIPPPVDVPVGPLEDILDGTAVKLLARHESLAPEAFWSAVEVGAGHLLTTTWSSSTALVEMSGPDVTKASTLALLCDELGIASDEVLAFGDMPNDLPLLAWAGSSYAMANAHPSVLEVADHVAPRNDDDGVATVLAEHFGLEPSPRR